MWDFSRYVTQLKWAKLQGGFGGVQPGWVFQGEVQTPTRAGGNQFFSRGFWVFFGIFLKTYKLQQQVNSVFFVVFTPWLMCLSRAAPLTSFSFCIPCAGRQRIWIKAGQPFWKQTGAIVALSGRSPAALSLKSMSSSIKEGLVGVFYCIVDVRISFFFFYSTLHLVFKDFFCHRSVATSCSV